MARQKRQFMRQGVGDLPDRPSVLAYVGAPGEPIFDGERLRMHDGVTPGGVPLVRAGRKAVADANYPATATDSYIGIATLTAPRIVSLPAASNFVPGQTLYVVDESGACAANMAITISASGSDKIAGRSSVVMSSPYQKLAFHSNGSNLWTPDLDASGSTVAPDGAAPIGRLSRTAWDAAVSTADVAAQDNLATFNAEMTARDAAGVLYRLTPGSFAFSSPLVQLPGRSVAGAGHAHLAFYQAQNASKRQNGTVLLVQGQAGKPTYALQGPRYGSVSLRGLSIYETSTAAISALLDMGRTMHTRVVDVELAGLNARAPVGLNCDGDLTNGTLYAGFDDLKISNTKTAIRIRDVANALSFRGGSFEGSMYCLDIDGSIYNPTGINFSGSSFENTFGPDTQIKYCADGSAIRGWPNTGPCYAAKLMRIAHCNGVVFDGCYYELGGIPATYNDGTHGTLPIVPVISVEAGAHGVDLGRLSYVYLLDAGEGTRATLNNGMRYDGTRNVGLHIGKGSAQTIPAYGFQTVLFDGPAAQHDDTQIAYGADGTITFKEAGDYDLNAVVYFEQVSGNVMARIQANLPGLRVLNGNSGYAPDGNFLSVAMSTTLLGMTAGQTLRIEAFQASANSQTMQGYATQTFCVLSKR